MSDLPDRIKETAELAAEAARKSHDAASAMAQLQRQVDQLHERVFNGLGKDLRSEIAKEVKDLDSKIETKFGSLDARIWAIMVALFLGAAGVIITGVIGQRATSSENNKNFEAILNLDEKLSLHLGIPQQPPSDPSKTAR